jgi:small subunit ribosomal protein S6
LNLYEAMFLFDPTFAGSLENCEAEIKRIIDRAEGELVFLRKWEERRLAFKLKGRKRGVYVLTYFKAPPAKITGMERDAMLSENVLRVLVLRADGMTPELMEKAAAPRAVEPAEGDYEGRGDRGGDRRGPRSFDREAVGAGRGPRGGTVAENRVPDASNE